METLQATKDLDACVVGVPVDGATSNRPGTRSALDELTSYHAITYTYCTHYVICHICIILHFVRIKTQVWSATDPNGIGHGPS